MSLFTSHLRLLRVLFLKWLGLGALLVVGGSALHAGLLDWDDHVLEVDENFAWQEVGGPPFFETIEVDTFESVLTDVGGISGLNATLTITRNVTSGSIARFEANYPQVNYDPIDYTGGGLARSLQLTMEQFESTSSWISVEVSFSEMVQNVSFTLHDVDFGAGGSATNKSFDDQISNIYRQVGDDTYEHDYASVSYDASYVQETSDGVFSGAGIAVDDSTQGDLTINFGSNWGSSFYFEYSPGPASKSNPTAQAIAMGDIQFTIVPETGTTVAFGLVLCGVVGASFWSRRRAREVVEA